MEKNNAKQKEKDLVAKIEENVDEKMLAERERIEQSDKEIKQDIEELNNKFCVLSQGVLSIQGRQFRADCRQLLQEGHVITLDEYEELESDFDTYKALGGNHTGDALHTAVQEKFQSQITK